MSIFDFLKGNKEGEEEEEILENEKLYQFDNNKKKT